jgi:hypothetical protein
MTATGHPARVVIDQCPMPFRGLSKAAFTDNPPRPAHADLHGLRAYVDPDMIAHHFMFFHRILLQNRISHNPRYRFPDLELLIATTLSYEVHHAPGVWLPDTLRSDHEAGAGLCTRSYYDVSGLGRPPPVTRSIIAAGDRKQHTRWGEQSEPQQSRQNDSDECSIIEQQM